MRNVTRIHKPPLPQVTPICSQPLYAIPLDLAEIVVSLGAILGVPVSAEVAPTGGCATGYAGRRHVAIDARCAGIVIEHCGMDGFTFVVLHEIAHVQLFHTTATRERDLAADELAALWAARRLGWPIDRVMRAASFLNLFPPDAVHADAATRLMHIRRGAQAGSAGFDSAFAAAVLA